MLNKRRLSVEIDEQWGFTGHKKRQSWILYALEHRTRKVLAYVIGRRTKKNVIKLLRLLKDFDRRRYYTDGSKVYRSLLPGQKHYIGKANTQRIERSNLTFRQRIKRIHRKTICYSKKLIMHRIVIGLFINCRYFGLNTS